MTLRIGWLSPFNNRTGVGTFSKAITDAMPDRHDGEEIDLSIVAPLAPGLYGTRHRVIDIDGTAPDSRFYDLFDVLVCNIGNNTEHHGALFKVLRNVPSVVICHDYVYQHFLATLVYDRGKGFADYVALTARYGAAEALRVVRRSNLTRGRGLLYAPWDSEFSAEEPLAAPLLQLGSGLVVHSAFAERYGRAHFEGPILRLGMPYDQRPRARPEGGLAAAREGERVTLVSFGHVQSTKCIDDVLRAISTSPRLRERILYVVSGFAGDRRYLDLLHALVAEHGLEDCVRFSLNLSDAGLDRLSLEADGFVNLRHPNTEGASVSLIEQLTTGKPVVVLDSGCYAEVPDGAAIKVARPRDVVAIRDALEQMLDRQADLAAIGRRGRAHAMRLDCRGYVAGLLDFIGSERALLRRRGQARARCLIDVEAPGPIEDEADEADEAWAGRLATARTTFDLIDQGCLALDPALLRELGPERAVDYVQAAILCDGTNHRLTTALRAYFRGREDVYWPVRVIQIVRNAVIEGDGEAQACLAEICPHADLTFWAVMEALGADALAAVAHRAFFGSAPPETMPAGVEPGPAGRAVQSRWLADALAGRDRSRLAAPEPSLDALVAWLRRSGWEADMALEPLPVGSVVTIGTSDQRRYLRLAGFFRPEADHVWTGAKPGLVYLQPARGARRIVLSGHTLNGGTVVSVTAQTRLEVHAGRPRPQGALAALDEFEIELPACEEATPLCLSIASSGCQSPADLGPSDDRRPLGFCLRQIAVA